MKYGINAAESSCETNLIFQKFFNVGSSLSKCSFTYNMVKAEEIKAFTHLMLIYKTGRESLHSSITADICIFLPSFLVHARARKRTLLPSESNINQLYRLVGGHLVVLTPSRPNMSPKSSCASEARCIMLSWVLVLFFSL